MNIRNVTIFKPAVVWVFKLVLNIRRHNFSILNILSLNCIIIIIITLCIHNVYKQVKN